ncbi:chemotaxis regulatory protein ChePep-like [Armigeres subalbatus]|uniref:chemotaxis regulatory protein ChePep-like n=1 Tax=Armigeres subalbatus TaxID=124917 RepID=UPI002ED1122B
MSSRGSKSASSTTSTDSYPSLYKSYSSKRTSSSSSLGTTHSSIASTHSATGSKILNIPQKETTCSTVPPRIRWDREAPSPNRPYDSRKYDIPFKPLQPYLSQLGGLGVPPRKPCDIPKSDPFHKRTQVDESFHKRVTDASIFSITEQPRSNVCLEEKSPAIEYVALRSVKSVILADNIDSDGSDSSDTEFEENLSEMSWTAFLQQPKRDEVLKQCKRSFFQARKELFKLRQHDDYLEEKNRQPVEVESWEISSDSTVELEDSSELDMFDKQEEVVSEVFETSDEYKPTEVIHEEYKLRFKEHEQTYMESMRKHMWSQYEIEEEQQKEEEAKRQQSPEPVEEEEIIKNVPKQDYLNLKKHEYRQQLADRLEEINRSIKRKPQELPQTAVQFEKYNGELMRKRRELRDEARVVDEHYKKAGLELDVPEKDIKLRKFRAADHKSEADESEDEDLYQSSEAEEEPVVHTCMTRLEWARWMGRCTKLEKLKLPQVRIPRLPKLVHKSEQSPIKMYIIGLHKEDKQIKTEAKKESLDAIDSKRDKTKTVKWHLKDMLYEKPKEYRLSKFVPYRPPIRPFPELAKDRFKVGQAVRRRCRDRRKNHMVWIDQLVEGICNRNYL